MKARCENIYLGFRMENDQRPSAKNPPLTLLENWLDVEKGSGAATPSYRHMLIRQNPDFDQKIWDELFAYIDHAHEGARNSLRSPLGDSLHPLQHGTQDDPASNYPHKLNDTALKGFFGEIIAGIIAKYYIADNVLKWEVPAYLFRTHIVAFQQLEVMKQSDRWDRTIVGRTGDDGLAFARDENGEIVAWLACEAKCTKGHSSALINDNHVKLSQAVTRPVDLLRLIDALQDYRDDEYSQDWVKELRRYFWQDSQNTIVTRCDFSMYVCGRLPKIKQTWISTEIPNSEYSGRRNLTCAEFHLADVENIIHSLYERMDDSS